MIALFRLLHGGEIFFEFRFLFKRRAVDAGEHLVLFIPPPVRAGNARQFERLDPPRGRQVRSAAEIDEIPLLIKRDLRALRQIRYEFLFIRLVKFLHQFERVLSGQGETFDGQIAFHDLLHFRFDLFQILLRDGGLEIDVVVKPVFDDRPDGEFAGGINGLDRLRQNVGRRVTEHIQPLFVFEGNDLQRAVVRQNVR